MTEEQNAQLEELFKEKLREQYNKGIQVGILSISKIITDKLKDSSIPLPKRLEEIKRFCRIAPSVEQKFDEMINKNNDTETERTDAVEENMSDKSNESEQAEAPKS